MQDELCHGSQGRGEALVPESFCRQPSGLEPGKPGEDRWVAVRKMKRKQVNDKKGHRPQELHVDAQQWLGSCACACGTG